MPYACCEGGVDLFREITGIDGAFGDGRTVSLFFHTTPYGWLYFGHLSGSL